MNDIYVPILSEGKAQLYLVEAGFQTSESAVFSICNRIKGQGNEGIETLIDKIDFYYKDYKDYNRITLQLKEVESKKFLKPDDITLNTQSIALGLLIKVIIQNENRQVHNNYDKIVITGNFLEDRLVEINDVIEKYNTIPKDNSEKILFVYISDKVVKLEYFNNVTIKQFNTTEYKLSDVINYIFAPMVEYYETWVDKNGIPFGIGKLTPEQVAQRCDSYKFVIKNGQIDKVVHINSLGNPVENSGTFENPVIQEIAYLDDKTIKIRCINILGSIKYIKEYKKINGVFNRLNFYKGSESCAFHLFSNSLQQSFFNPFDLENTKAEISSYKFERDFNGFITKKTYLRFHGENYEQSDSNGIYGEEYVLAPSGQICEKRFLGKNGRRIQNNREKFSYNNDYECIEKIRFGNDGIQSSKKIKYDEFGNKIEEIFYDSNSKKINILKYKYNKLGQPIEILSLDGNKNPFFTENFAPLTRFTYDENGYQSSMSFYEISGEPIIYKIDTNIDHAFCHKICIECDENGLIKKVSYFDINGEPFDRGDGTSIITHEYDDKGNIIEDQYFDKTGKIKIDLNGIACCKNFFDEENLLVKKMFFDENHKPTKTADGYYAEEYKYYKGDVAENIEEIRLIDLKGKLSDTTDGIAKRQRIYNGMGLLVDEYFYDMNDNLAEKEGIAHLQNKYDDMGNLIQQSFFDSKDKLTCLSLGEIAYATRTIRKDDSEEINILLDENGNPLFQEKADFDEYGNKIKITQYVYKSTEMFFSNCLNQKFDTSGNVIEQFNTDKDGNIIQGNEGGFITRLEYDNRGFISCIKHYNAENRLITIKGQKYSYCKKNYDYMGNITEEFFYDTNNKPFLRENENCFGWTTDYDSLGRPVARWFLDKNKKKICASDGTFCLQIKYNAIYDNLITISLLSRNFRVIDESKGFYEMERIDSAIIFSFNCSKLNYKIKVRLM